MAQDRDNSGALFKNEKTKPTQPDYTGPCKVNGVELRIAAWLEKDKQEKPYLSVKFSEKYNSSEAGNAKKPDEPRDDIPF